MLLQEVVNTQTLTCIRAFHGRWADLARLNKPIPVPPRGISWWKFSQTQSAYDLVDRESTYWYGGFDPDTNKKRKDVDRLGVVVATTCQYVQRGGWIIFEHGWGLGVEEEPLPSKTSKYYTADEWKKAIIGRGAQYYGNEIFIPNLPLNKNGTWDISYNMGICSNVPTSHYKIIRDLDQESLR